MKKYIKLIIIVLLLVSALVINTQVKAMLPLSGKLILIDIGHGGADPGTVNNNIKEKDINLAIGKALEIELVKVGATVILTRNGDYDLSSPNVKWRKKSDFDNRIKLINNSKADMYLSIHLNYLTDNRYSGAQVFYNNVKNKEIALVIQEALNTKLNGKREVRKIPSKTYMYDKLKIPGVLIECGFLSNYEEMKKLITKEYQNKLALIIKEGIISYY